jgi:RNA polymerase sigma-70 factor (ECF subfamily)
VKVAINLRHVGASFRRDTVGLTHHSKLKAQRLLSKGTPSSGPERSLQELKDHRADSSSLTDTIRLAQQGDAAAFELIYELHCRRVYALCLRMLRDPVEAEDLAQDVYVQLFRKIHTFRGESAFSSWLHRLTMNVVLMHLRRKKPISTSLDEITGSDQEEDRPRNEIGAPDLRLSGLVDRLTLQAAIDPLPEGYRTIFILHDVQGYKHGEIAEILACSVGNSKSQLHKARKRLRELLKGPRRNTAQQNHETAGNSFALAASY